MADIFPSAYIFINPPSTEASGEAPLPRMRHGSAIVASMAEIMQKTHDELVHLVSVDGEPGPVADRIFRERREDTVCQTVWGFLKICPEWATAGQLRAMLGAHAAETPHLGGTRGIVVRKADGTLRAASGTSVTASS